MAIEYLPVSWTTYHQHAVTLADRLLSDNKKPDEIVAISRGGLTIGHLLSDLLHIPISTITIQSYTDIQTQGELKITQELHTPIEKKSVLLVDDVADSGKTLLRATDYLKTFHPTHVTTATMYYKPRSEFRPDYFAETTTKWILFPYEPAEMLTHIMGQMRNEGKSDDDIATYIRTLGYTDDQIAFVRKHYFPKMAS